MSSQVKTIASVNLTSAGTAQLISTTSIVCQSIVITANASNTGTIYIGDANVSATRFTLALAAGAVGTIDGPMVGGSVDDMDLNEIYFDGGTTNDDINVGYQQRTT